MYKATERLDIGNIEDKIWKYMDLSKFLYLVINKKLYFSRLDQFEDVFEAEVPKANLDDCMPEYRIKQMNSYKKLSKIIRLVTYTTCFHLNDYESAAMWRLYSDEAGIAIQTNVENLINSLNNEKKIFILVELNILMKRLKKLIIWV